MQFFQNLYLNFYIYNIWNLPNPTNFLGFKILISFPYLIYFTSEFALGLFTYNPRIRSNLFDFFVYAIETLSFSWSNVWDFLVFIFYNDKDWFILWLDDADEWNEKLLFKLKYKLLILHT